MRWWALIVLGLAATVLSLTTLGGMTKAQAASQPTLTGHTWQLAKLGAVDRSRAGITALFMLLQTLTAIVQALIFSLLTTVYLYMMLPHESHEAHGHGEVAATPHHGP